MAQPLELELQVTVDKSQFIKEMDAFGRKIERSGEKLENNLTKTQKDGERDRERANKKHNDKLTDQEERAQNERLRNQKEHEDKSHRSLQGWADRIKGSVLKLGAAIGTAAIFAGIVRATSMALAFGDSIRDTSDVLGVSTQALQVWRIMAQRAGIEFSQLSSVLENIASKETLAKFDMLVGDFDTIEKKVQFLLQQAQGGPEVLAKLGFSPEIGKVLNRIAVNSGITVTNIEAMSALIKAEGYKIFADDEINKLDSLSDKIANFKEKLTLAVVGGIEESSGSLDKFVTSLEESFKTIDFKAMTDGLIAIAKIIGVIGVVATPVIKLLGILKVALADFVGIALGKMSVFLGVTMPKVLSGLSVMFTKYLILPLTNITMRFEKLFPILMKVNGFFGNMIARLAKLSDWLGSIALRLSLFRVKMGFLGKLFGGILKKAPWIALGLVLIDFITIVRKVGVSWKAAWLLILKTIDDLTFGVIPGLGEKIDELTERWQKQADAIKDVKKAATSLGTGEVFGPPPPPPTVAFKPKKEKEVEIPVKLTFPSIKGDAIETYAPVMTIGKFLNSELEKAQKKFFLGFSSGEGLSSIDKLKQKLASIGDVLTSLTTKFGEIIGVTADLVNVGIDAMFTSQTENQLVGIQKIIDKEQERWDRQRQNLIDNGAQNTAYFKNRVVEERKLQEKLAIQERGIQAKLFDQEKGANIAGTIMNTAQGVMAAWAKGPFIGAIMSGIILATGATQVAMIAAQNNPYRRAAGGFIPGQGYSDNVPVLATPGEFVVNRNASRDNADLLQAINSGNKLSANPGQSININIAGNLIARDNWVEEELIPSINNALDRGYSLRMA